MDTRIKKKILAFYDSDSTYTERLSRYLGKRSDCIFDVRGFSDQKAFDDFVRRTPIEVLLVSKEAMTQELDTQSDMVFMLAEDSGEQDESHETVYKYQSSDLLIREVMAAYEARKLSCTDGEGKMKAEVIGVYSPVGRCYKTTFSLVLGMLLSERAPSIYLSFEDYPGISSMLREAGDTAEEKAGDDLSDILYYRRVSKEEKGRLFHAIRCSGKLSYIPPVSCPADIRSAKPEELASIAASLGGSELYRYLILDVGNAIADPIPLFSLCSRIFVPGRRDKVSESKIAAFQEYLGSIGQEDILRRLEYVSVPTYAQMEEGVDMVSAKLSPLGRYMEKHMGELGFA